MKKQILTLFILTLFAAPFGARAQLTVVPQDTGICPGNSVQLTAASADTNYLIDSSISYGLTYNPANQTMPTGATAVSLTDDDVSSDLPIGFTFTFFGNDYTNFRISSNGFIGFGISDDGCCSGESIPSTTTPNNFIAFAWEDTDPGNGVGTVSYKTAGSAPNRRLIVTYDSIPHFSSGNNVTCQVILHESSNIIEMQTKVMPSDGGSHTMGLENASGTDGIAFPGRNAMDWSTSNEGVRFIPSGEVVWHKDSMPNPIDTSVVTTVMPDSTSKYYGVLNDSSGTYIDSAMVEIFPYPGADFTYSITDGQIVEFNDTSANAIEWDWDFGDGFTADDIEDPTHIYNDTGTYVVQLTVYSDSGCVDTHMDTVHIESMVGIAEHAGQDAPAIELRPNPSKGPVNVQLNGSTQGGELKVIGLDGRIVERFEIPETRKATPVKVELPADLFEEGAGVYMIRGKVSGKTRTKKLIRTE